jgi:arsenate reductase
MVAMLKLYVYAKCSTCRDAIKWLSARGIKFEERAIRETPPSVAELKAMLAANDGNLRAIMNSSGMDYRAMGLKDKLPGMSQDEVLKLLAKHGNLVKRPFAMDQKEGVFLTGFKVPEWRAALG